MIYNRKEKKDIVYFLRHFSRILIGVLFIFSGYVKMVDPFGFGLKIEEYFVSFGLNFMTPTSLFFAGCAILAEFLLGWALLLNIQMKITSWILLLFMGFFTILTCWLAYAHDILKVVNNLLGTNYEIFIVTDCGCFGDFIKLTNHQTFYKNLIFLFFTLIIFQQRNKFKNHAWYYITEWAPLVLVAGFGIFTMIHCLRHEPWHDFRPWNIGKFIAAETYSVAPEMDIVFIYQNNNDHSKREISMEQLTQMAEDSTAYADLENNYTFVDRKEIIVTPGINARLADFSITEPSQNVDIKDMVINQKDYNFIIFLRDMTKLKAQQLINIKQLINDCNVKNINYIVLTGSTYNIADSLKQVLNLNCDLYFCDMTPMKTAIRNNAGVIMLKNGYIMDKWAFRDVPTLNDILINMPQYEQQLQKYIQKQPPILSQENTLPNNNETLTTEQTTDNYSDSTYDN